MRGMLPSTLSAKHENCTTAEKTVLLTCPMGIQRTGSDEPDDGISEMMCRIQDDSASGMRHWI